MSAICVLYGMISGAHGSTSNWWDLYPINRQVIDSLPTEDENPPLIRDMFKLPDAPDIKNPILYRNQIIHFGASFNHFDSDYEQWLEKFEGLLKQLYWYEAKVHLEMEMFGHFEFQWRATPKALKRFGLENPTPVSEWEFSKIIKN